MAIFLGILAGFLVFSVLGYIYLCIDSEDETVSGIFAVFVIAISLFVGYSVSSSQSDFEEREVKARELLLKWEGLVRTHSKD